MAETSGVLILVVFLILVEFLNVYEGELELFVLDRSAWACVRFDRWFDGYRFSSVVIRATDYPAERDKR